MKKLSLLALLLSSSLALAAPAFTIGGVSLSLPTVQQGGKLYVDAAALAEALGFTLTFDQAKNTYILQARSPAGPTGSGQLAGGLGTLGQTYALTNNDGSPLNFTLQSAEFTAMRVNIDQQSYIPAADQKLLVLHFSVQNAGPSDSRFSWSSLRFTVVDDQNTNWKNEEAVGREGSSEPVDMRLKPAQKIDVYTVIMLPTGNSTPKLLVQADNQALIRYDLHGAVQPVAAPYADPQNPLTARPEVPAAAGSFLQIGTLDARLDGAALTDAALTGTAPSGGHRYLVASLTFKNATTSRQRVSYNNVLPVLSLASGDKVNWNQALLKAGSDDPLDLTLAPGEDVHARVFFEVPTSDAPSTLGLAQDTSRRLVFDVSAAK